MNKNFTLLEFNEKEISELNIKLLNKKYKKVAFKYHPDRPNGDEIKFKEISKAYNELKKKLNMEDKYNFIDDDEFKNYTEKIINKGEYFKTIFSSLKNLDVDNLLSKFMKYTNEIKNIYDNNNCKEKTDDIIVNISVSLEDIYNNEDKIITLTRNKRCIDCYDNEFRFCIKCNNTNYVQKEKSYIFCCSDSVIVFSGESNEEKNKKPGDIIIKINPKEHGTYCIINNYDILYEIDSDKLDSINHSFTYLDNKIINFKADFPWKKKYIMSNKGLSKPYSEGKGDLIIKINYVPVDLEYDLY